MYLHSNTAQRIQNAILIPIIAQSSQNTTVQNSSAKLSTENSLVVYKTVQRETAVEDQALNFLK